MFCHSCIHRFTLDISSESLAVRYLPKRIIITRPPDLELSRLRIPSIKGGLYMYCKRVSTPNGSLTKYFKSSNFARSGTLR